MPTKILPVLFLIFATAGTAGVEEPLKIVAGPMFSVVDTTHLAVWVQTNRPERLVFSMNRVSRDAAKLLVENLSREIHTSAERRNIACVIVPIPPPGEYEFSFSAGTKPPDEFKMILDARFRLRTPPLHGESGRYTIAFGSCSHQEKFGEHQPIWDAIVREKPDCFLFIGDNIYLPNRLEEFPGKRDGVLKLYCDRYDHQRQMPEMQVLLRSTYSFALWDDHDFGKNNSNRRWPWKGVAREALNLYFPNNYGLPDAKGCFYRFAWGDIDVFMTDDRTFRDPNDDPNRRTFLGEKQLAWLKDGLAQSKASFKLIVCGNQILADTHPHESWGVQFRPERDAFLDWLWEKKITGVIFLSGDRHFAELTRKRAPKGRGGDLWDLTSSPLANEVYKDGPTFESADRVAAYSDGVNFGVLDFDTTGKHRHVVLCVMDVNGKEVIRRRVELP
ncbi:MAG: hypothetical protein AMXMBFR20_18340 [Planctomycetia bacterium]